MISVGKLEPLALLVGMQNYATAVENGIALPQNNKNKITMWSSSSSSGYIHVRIEGRVSKIYLHTHVHHSIIHNSWKIEATPVSISGWMEKQIVIHTYNGILSSL